MAAELATGALLSGFINVLFDRLATEQDLNFFRGKQVIADLLYELKIMLMSANVLLNDAEEKQWTDENVKMWLDELKDLLYEADRVIDKINTEAMRRELEQGSKPSKFFNCISTFFGAFENTVKSEIEQILRKLRPLLDQNQNQIIRFLTKVNPKTSSSSKRLYAPMVEESEVFGRDADKERIIESLLSEYVGGHKISVVSIVGMGGIGKTALAQVLVYKDSRVQKHFELKVRVTVSEDFDVPRMTKEILKAINSNTTCETDDLPQLQEKLKTALMGKKFLFVLDDVWNENYQFWDLLKSPFESGAHGSKILVTTRNKTVAERMRSGIKYELGGISDDCSLQLFAKHVFNQVDFGPQSNLKQIGAEIVKKCKGLPLAIISIAGLLHPESTQEEWNSILHSDVWKLQFQENHKNNILPALWLSYCYLPSKLKRCFSYCSIFPKDYEFDEDDQERLIYLWMAEGLLQPEEEKTMEKVGEEYLNALISRSFFQRSSKNRSTLLMHDLIHDLATHISGEFFYVLDYNDSSKLSKKTHRLLFEKKYEDSVKLEGSYKATCLRTLLALPLSSSSYLAWEILTKKFMHEFLQRDGQGCLRALSLSEFPMTKLPESIGKLKHLRYLDLSYSEVIQLPDSICTLYNLQTLMLSNCGNLTQLPSNMSNLINLRHLHFRYTKVKDMPPHMYNMKNLQTLSNFVLNKSDGSRIKELEKLEFLRGRLEIDGLENVVDIEDVQKTNSKKKDLTELILRWDTGDTNDPTKEMKVLNALQPNTNHLRELQIIGYRGTMVHEWVTHHSYYSLVEVTLIKCKYCCSLPPFGQLPSLRKLAIVELDGVVIIGDEFCGTSLTKPFPSLECLRIGDMKSLEKWSFTGADLEGSSIFPCLEVLRILSCNKLKVGIPIRYLPSLKRIDIYNCYEMEAVFGPTSDHQPIDTACPSLESIWMVSCPKLESFSGMEVPSNLKRLEVQYCEMLWANLMKWDILQTLSSLQRLFVEGYKQVVDSFPEEGQLLPTTLTSLIIEDFENLKALNGKALQQLTSLRRLEIGSSRNLSCLPEQGLPHSVSYLSIWNCPMLEKRCQRDSGEDWPKIQHILTIIINGNEI